MKLKSFIPRFIRMFISRKYADSMLDEAIEKADELHLKTGKRYFVLPTVSGDLKVTDVDNETRDRRRDNHILKKSVRKPYQLRRESYYFTASDVCKDRFHPEGMQPWEVEAMRKLFYKFYFKHH